MGSRERHARFYSKARIISRARERELVFHERGGHVAALFIVACMRARAFYRPLFSVIYGAGGVREGIKRFAR